MENNQEKPQCDLNGAPEKKGSCGCGTDGNKPCACGKIAAIAAVALAVLAVIYFKGGSCPLVSGCGSPAAESAQNRSATESIQRAAELKIPVLMELGAGYCSACKAMQPVIAGLQQEFSDRLMTLSVDVNNESGLAEKYSIRIIPTQIFLDAEGKEIFRHEGFYSRDDIMAKWKTLGFEFKIAPGAAGK